MGLLSDVVLPLSAFNYLIYYQIQQPSLLTPQQATSNLFTSKNEVVTVFYFLLFTVLTQTLTPLYSRPSTLFYSQSRCASSYLRNNMFGRIMDILEVGIDAPKNRSDVYSLVSVCHFCNVSLTIWSLSCFVTFEGAEFRASSDAIF